MMASSPASKSDTSRFVEKRGSTNDGNVPPSAASNVKRESDIKGEQFLASDSFYKRMEAMMKKDDVQAIIDKQKETLKKFEKTNAKFGKFNDLSADRFLNLNQQLKNHTKMLIDMKKDLDSIFRRIRTLKTKLAKQYGPAFQAISAGIQQLEEELGASIEKEDASSVYTLTESQEFKSESQPTNEGHAVGQQIPEEDISQVGISLPTPNTPLVKGSSDDQSIDNRIATDSDMFATVTKADTVEINEGFPGSKDRTVDTEGTVTETNYSDSGLFREALSVQEYKDVSTADTADIDDLARTRTVHVETDGTEVRRVEDTGAIRKTRDTCDITKKPDTGKDFVGHYSQTTEGNVTDGNF